MKNFNDIDGTTSSEFQINAGVGGGVRQFALTASSIGAGTQALDREGNGVSTNGVEFFDLKFVAKQFDSINSVTLVTTRHIRGSVNDGVITKVQDIFQQDVNADVTLGVNSGNFEMLCAGDSDVDVTIYLTMTRV